MFTENIYSIFKIWILSHRVCGKYANKNIFIQTREGKTTVGNKHQVLNVLYVIKVLCFWTIKWSELFQLLVSLRGVGRTGVTKTGSVDNNRWKYQQKGHKSTTAPLSASSEQWHIPFVAVIEKYNLPKLMGRDNIRTP